MFPERKAISNIEPHFSRPLRGATACVPVNGNGVAEAGPVEAKKRLNPIKRKQMEDRVHESGRRNQPDRNSHRALETALQNFVSAEESQRQSQELEQHKASHAALIKEWEDLRERCNLHAA